jgi:hypothetical protein
MTTRDPRETARKLLRLASSPNEHEAARAREKYEAYTKQHRIVLRDGPVEELLELCEKYERVMEAAMAPWERFEAACAAAAELEAAAARAGAGRAPRRARRRAKRAAGDEGRVS